MPNINESPTGRAPSAPEMQRIRPPLTVAQKRDVDAIRTALGREKPSAPLNLDFASLEMRVAAYELNQGK